MTSEKQRRSYVAPLGEFRGELTTQPDPIWVWIHQERVMRGLDINQLAELAGVTGGTISRGERGGSMTLWVTQAALRALGRTLTMTELTNE